MFFYLKVKIFKKLWGDNYYKTNIKRHILVCYDRKKTDVQILTNDSFNKVPIIHEMIKKVNSL
jgi:hypothetical protein